MGKREKGWFERLGKWTRIGVYVGIVAVAVVHIPRVMTMLGAYKFFGMSFILGDIQGIVLTMLIFVPIATAVGYLVDKFKA